MPVSLPQTEMVGGPVSFDPSIPSSLPGGMFVE